MVSMDGQTLLRYLLCGLVLFFLASGKVSALEDDDETDVPAGFENLDAPRQTAVEVWFAGQNLGAFPAQFTSRWIQFLTPEKLVEQVRNLKDNAQDRASVLKALTGKLDTHTAQVCRKQNGENCPVIHPAVAGVIFKASAFEARLFIHPSLQEIQTRKQKRYLGDASSNFSAIQGLGLTVSGARGEKSTHHYSWYGRSLAAWQETHVYADWGYDKSDHFSVGSLYGERDWQGQNLQAGLFTGSSTGLTFTADPKMIGMRIAHSASTLNQNVPLNTTPVVVYLPVRGRVELFRNGALLEARMLDAGRQQLDTRSLPQGAYNLTVKTYEGATLLNEQKLLFVKSNRLPGLDDPVYFLEVGRPVVEQGKKVWPGVQQGWLARGGYNFLLQDNTALAMAASVRNSDALAEVGLLHIGPWVDVSGGVMLARHRRRGVYGEARVQLGKGQLLGGYRSLNHQGENKEHSLLAQGSRTGQFSYSRPLGRGSLTLGSDWQKFEGDQRTLRTDHMSVGWNVIENSRMQLRVGVEASRNRNNKQLLASITLSHRSGNRETGLSHIRQDTRQDTSSTKTRELAMVSRASVRWQNQPLPEKIVGGGVVTGGVYAERQRARHSAGLDGRLSGRKIGAQLSVDKTWADNVRAVTSYTGNIGTSVLADPDGVFVGGGQISDSGVLVHLKGEGASLFDIQVDGQTVTRGRIGDSVPVVLSPFREYQIGITNAGDSFSDYEDRRKTIVLYPGNVVQISFTATAVEPVLGILQSPSGELLADAMIENSQNQTVSDSHGFFQARLVVGTNVLKVIQRDGSLCEVVLPAERRKKRGVTLFGRLLCKPAS